MVALKIIFRCFVVGFLVGCGGFFPCFSFYNGCNFDEHALQIWYSFYSPFSIKYNSLDKTHRVTGREVPQFSKCLVMCVTRGQ